MMRTISLRKVNIIRSTLFVVVLLVAFAMAFAVTARPSHAVTLEGDCVYIEDFSPGVSEPSSINPTEFELYKVGHYVVGEPYVVLDDEPFNVGVELPLKADPTDNVAWTKTWLKCAQTLNNNIMSTSPAPESIKVSVDSEGKFSKSGLANGLYLLRGNSQVIEDYPKAGQKSYWWPQPMLISILNSDTEVHVKPMTGLVRKMKVQKDWQWPSGISEAIKKIASPDSIKVELYYDNDLKDTRVLPDEKGNWYYTWEPALSESDPSKWAVKEVIEDDPETEVDESKEFYKNFTVSYGELQSTDEEEIITITNKYDRDVLEITKTLDSYVDNGKDNSISIVFELSGYKDGDSIYHKIVAMEFDAETGDKQVLPVKDIPLGLDKLMVKEIDSSNYTPDQREKEATPPTANDDGSKGPYKVSFDNTHSNHTHNSGVINKFKLTENGYVFDKSLGTGE